MRHINKFIIHCSYSDKPRHDNIETIRRWHIERGFSDIGYHFVITKDGNIKIGRPIDQAGAHCYGKNNYSVGICLTGKNNFTNLQFKSCRRIIQLISHFVPDATVHGHCEFSKEKPYCPGFDYQKEIIDKI